MVNCCCVYGCGRNSRRNKLLTYYCLPKDVNRQTVWLKAAGREDLLELKPENRSSTRFCSRHFEPSSIKNKHLCATAVPTKNLPGSLNNDITNDTLPPQHHNIICNSCNSEIHGFRYKCINCPDYDLCPKCEMLEIHPEHFVIRIPKPIKLKVIDELANKWQEFFKAPHLTPGKIDDQETSSDDEPITKYVKNYDSGIDLSEDIKTKIRNEVTRVLKVTREKGDIVKRKSLGKRQGQDSERNSKKQKIQDDNLPEVAFADVNEINNHEEIKNEVMRMPSSGSYGQQAKDGFDIVLAALTFANVETKWNIDFDDSECISEK